MVPSPFITAQSQRAPALLEEVRSYRGFWQQFLAKRSLCPHRRDSQEWVAGRGPLLLLIVRVPPEGGLARQIIRVQNSLRGIPGLELHPPYFLHLTVQMLGFLSSRGAPRAEEVTDSRLRQAVELLYRALSWYPAFPIAVGGANSFFSCPFLETYHGGHLRRLRKLVREEVSWVREVDPWEGYAFHLTIGYYGPSAEWSVALAALRSLRGVHLGRLWVRELELVAVETRSGEPYPPILTLARFPLAPALVPRAVSSRIGGELGCTERPEVLMSLQRDYLGGAVDDRSGARG